MAEWFKYLQLFDLFFVFFVDKEGFWVDSNFFVVNK